MRTFNFQGATATILESGESTGLQPHSNDEEIKVDHRENCKKANARAIEKCKAIRAESPTATHTVTVTIGGVRGRIPFTPDR